MTMNHSSTLSKIETVEGNPDGFPFALPPRDFLTGEVLDRFLARCYLMIEQWADQLEAQKQNQDQVKKVEKVDEEVNPPA